MKLPSPPITRPHPPSPYTYNYTRRASPHPHIMLSEIQLLSLLLAHSSIVSSRLALSSHHHDHRHQYHHHDEEGDAKNDIDTDGDTDNRDTDLGATVARGYRGTTSPTSTWTWSANFSASVLLYTSHQRPTYSSALPFIHPCLHVFMSSSTLEKVRLGRQ